MSLPNKRLPVAGLCFLFSLFFLQAASAQEQPILDRNLFSIGAGFSSNEVGSSENETGFQFLVGYDLPQVNLMQGVKSSAEFGFMDYGFDEDDTGIWGSYVIDGAVLEGFGWLAQIGLDIGDDSGLLFGAGLQFKARENMDIRVDYVVRDEVDSLQFNFIFDL